MKARKKGTKRENMIKKTLCEKIKREKKRKRERERERERERLREREE